MPQSLKEAFLPHSREPLNPTVSVVIPCYQEAEDIAVTLQCFLQSKYPAIIEVLVIDGMSTDGTRDIVKKLAKQDSRVKLLDNPGRYQSLALNIALGHCRGDVFLRADAHCVYAADYVEACVQALLETDALNVGGAQRFVARTPYQASVAMAVASPFGSGGARYRNWEYNGYAETVFLGCFWRAALLRIGGYDPAAITNEDYAINLRLRLFSEVNVTNQDTELNERLVRVSASAIYISSAIVAYYYPRKSVLGLWRQYFRYGRGRLITSARNRVFICRGHLPAYAFAQLLWLPLLFWYCGVKVTLLLLAIIPLLLLLESMRLAFGKWKSLSRAIWRIGEPCPAGHTLLGRIFLNLAVMPLAHSLGFWYQGLKILTRGKVQW